MTILISGQHIPYDTIHHHIGSEAVWITASGRRMPVIIRAPILKEDKFAIEPKGDFFTQDAK